MDGEGSMPVGVPEGSGGMGHDGSPALVIFAEKALPHGPRISVAVALGDRSRLAGRNWRHDFHFLTLPSQFVEGSVGI
jgi:hypothetical protein